MTSEELQTLLKRCKNVYPIGNAADLMRALVEVASEVPCPKCLYRRPRSPAELSEGIPEWPKCSACNGTGNKYNLGVGDDSS